MSALYNMCVMNILKSELSNFSYLDYILFQDPLVSVEKINIVYNKPK